METLLQWFSQTKLSTLMIFFNELFTIKKKNIEDHTGKGREIS